MLLLGLAIAPGLAVCLYIFYRDKYNKEPASTLLVSFIFGVLSTIPAVIVELAAEDLTSETVTGIIISAFFFVALVEEFCKFIPLRYYSLSRKSFDEPLDGIIHSVMIGMGFATLENIGYVLTSENGMQVALMRMFTSVPGHASFAAVMGYYAGKARFNFVNKKALLLKGLLLATFFHGLYDSCLFLTKVLPGTLSVLLLILGALASLITGIVLSLKLIRLHRRTSGIYHIGKPVLTIRNATSKDIRLIRSLALDIWPKSYGKILSRQQITYMLNLIYSEQALKKQIQQHHQFIIVYNTGLPVGFASYSETKPAVYKLHKLYVLPSQQGKGTGTFVLEQIMSDIKAKGAVAMQLNVNRNNSAKLFYEKLGFEVIASEDIDIGSGFFMNDYVMEKSFREMEQTELPAGNKEDKSSLN